MHDIAALWAAVLSDLAAIDKPDRFRRSRNFGTCFDLVPCRHRLGEVDSAKIS
jgi:hypothetical protein